MLKDRHQRGHYPHRNDISQDPQSIRPLGEHLDPLALDAEALPHGWTRRFAGRGRRAIDGCER